MASRSTVDMRGNVRREPAGRAETKDQPESDHPVKPSLRNDDRCFATWPGITPCGPEIAVDSTESIRDVHAFSGFKDVDN